jgi:hypothetical protein
MILYKLTNQQNETRGPTVWGRGVTHSVDPCKNPKLCTKNVIHAYTNQNLALILNPFHVNILDPRLWLAEGDIAEKDWGKVGCFKLTTIEELSIPGWHSNEDRRKTVAVQFAVLCAEAVIEIYEKRCPSDDRPRNAIEAAKEYLKAHAADAAYAADAAAQAAADAAAYAAAYAADAAAQAAADAAAYAAHAAKIEFAALADLAVKMEEEVTNDRL